MEAVGQHAHFNLKACRRINRKSFAGDGGRRLGAGFHCRDKLTESARSRLSRKLYCLLAEAQTTEISRLGRMVRSRRGVKCFEFCTGSDRFDIVFPTAVDRAPE
jgi:hypothetical protein